MSRVPAELINKILSYNIHPVAELIRPYFIEYDILYKYYNGFYDYIFTEVAESKDYCWYCQKSNIKINTGDKKHFCEDCYIFFLHINNRMS
jgi:hypothetical protein